MVLKIDIMKPGWKFPLINKFDNRSISVFFQLCLTKKDLVKESIYCLNRLYTSQTELMAWKLILSFAFIHVG